VAVSAEDLRRRVIGWRQAERREHRVRAEAGPLDPVAAMNAALELYDFLPVHTCAPDDVRAREVAAARHAWHTLRIRLAAR
jgi:hypothetical protein